MNADSVAISVAAARQIRLRWSGRDAALLVVLPLVILISSWLATYQLSLRANVASATQHNGAQLDFVAASLDSELDKYSYLPELLTLQPDVHALLNQTSDAAIQARLNRWLREMQVRSHASAIYLLDETGLTVAASNYLEPGSFVGQSYAFRPYYLQAIRGERRPFYAIGATTGEPGCFLAVAISDGKRPIGVAVVKVSLADIEAAWSKSGAAIALSDEHGVLFLSAIANWRYRSLSPLSPTVQQAMKVTRQYGTGEIAPLTDDAIAVVAPEQRLNMSLPAQYRSGWSQNSRSDTLVQTRPTSRSDWRVVMFSALDAAHGTAISLANSVVLAFALLWLAGTSWRLRKRGLNALAVSRLQLQRAHDELETRITARTDALTEANALLRARVIEQAEAERVLRVTQDELVQAGKMTLLGQMAAGVSHELNQPLTAMRALSANTVELLNQQRTDEVCGNLQAIEGLSDRMGHILSQLRVFARRSDDGFAPFAVNAALDDALRLMEAPLRAHKVEVTRIGARLATTVQGDRVRLGQVFVNLVRNAMDAMNTRADGTLMLLQVMMEQDSETVFVRVADNGPGLSAHALQHLFEPFYTSKDAGKGLGLGLSISRSIVKAMGGELTAENLPTGGATFCVNLPINERDDEGVKSD